ncbi:DUF2712 domain-containing protein [Sporolactobacillus kofuensis]|uniref:DUF2712 domain-containing protein n=1 Tax=Sporolactobacillus kofuensis TaxID=269672 RepID=A0ABW1WB02_9BACL|nr:DUF2712 domain-containing protein [Sporolactobacillus kofuensis]MCO7175009.1 DUF2712 domain-containing protein [Sporolactobacillus kofuensis]
MVLDKKKLMKLILAGLIALCLLIPTISHAAEKNEYRYNFNIGPYQANSRVSDANAHKRTTTNIHEAWMVNLEGSEEGFNSITQFWMENKSGHNITPTVNAYSGRGEAYEKASDDATGVYCYLTAQNNNYNNNSYNVSGYWDEEYPKIVY